MRWHHVLTLHPAVLHGGAQGAAGQSFWARKLQEEEARSAAILFEGELVVTLPLDGFVGDFAAALVVYSLSNMLVALGNPLLANQLTILARSDFVLKRPANRSTFAPAIDLCAPTLALALQEIRLGTCWDCSNPKVMAQLFYILPRQMSDIERLPHRFCVFMAAWLLAAFELQLSRSRSGEAPMV
jgi:hypothetical protein